MEKSLDFNNIYTSNHEKIFKFINYKINNISVAQELTNDVFIKLNSHLNNYDENKATMSTWLHNIALRIVIDYYRKNKLNTMSLSVKDDDGKEMFDLKSHDKNPYELMVNNEKGELVAKAIDSLPDGYKELSRMFFLEGYSHKEIQEELELPNGTVKGKIFRARNILVKVLS